MKILVADDEEMIVTGLIKMIGQMNNPSYVCTMFKRELNLGFHDYINRIRMANSLDYLENKKLTISQISEKLGYQTERQFFRVFKAMTGITPGQYREQIFNG